MFVLRQVGDDVRIPRGISGEVIMGAWYQQIRPGSLSHRQKVYQSLDAVKFRIDRWVLVNMEPGSLSLP